jgi:hypothetical protein
LSSAAITAAAITAAATGRLAGCPEGMGSKGVCAHGHEWGLVCFFAPLHACMHCGVFHLETKPSLSFESVLATNHSIHNPFHITVLQFFTNITAQSEECGEF